jgi:hypothetical protein
MFVKLEQPHGTHIWINEHGLVIRHVTPTEWDIRGQHKGPVSIIDNGSRQGGYIVCGEPDKVVALIGGWAVEL